MAFLTDVVGKAIGTDSVALILAALGFASFVVAIIANVLSQLLLKDPSKPPVVFHWVPFIGNAVPFGKDPIKFYNECRAKVPIHSIHSS